MTADEATAAVESELVDPLRKKVTVTHDGVKYQLSSEKLEVDSDVEGMVDQALEESREGGLPTRVWRYATGGEVDVAISPQVTYSNKAIDEFIAKVSAEVATEPVNATIEPSAVSLEGDRRPGGHRRRRVGAAHAGSSRWSSARPKRKVSVPVDTVQPEVTKEDLAEQYPTYLTVNRSTFELTLWKDLEPAKTYTVAIGAAGFDTPAGVYNIQNKAVDPAWSVPRRRLGRRSRRDRRPRRRSREPAQGALDGHLRRRRHPRHRRHGSLGSAASHGCVRMAVPDVIELYDQVPVGTPIYIG